MRYSAVNGHNFIHTIYWPDQGGVTFCLKTLEQAALQQLKYAFSLARHTQCLSGLHYNH